MDTRYFGYGAHTSPKMIEVLLGKKMRGKPAVLKNFRLYIESWHSIPLAAQATLVDFWRPGAFRRYVMRSRRGYEVQGVLWKVTFGDLKIIQEWDMCDGRWTELQPVVVETEEGTVVAYTDVRRDWNDDLNPVFTPTIFLNTRQNMLRAARRLRKLMRNSG